MHINRISVSTNFGVRLTDKALAELKRNGASEFDIGTISCKSPTEALIGITKGSTHPYIEGKYGRYEKHDKKLTMQTLNQLCEEYNIEKFFSVLKPEKNSAF